MALVLGMLVAVAPSVALADDVRYTREQARKDGSVWLSTAVFYEKQRPMTGTSRILRRSRRPSR